MENAQDGGMDSGFTDEASSSVEVHFQISDISTKETSRDMTLYWNPIAIPSGRREWPFSQRVSNLAVSVIEQRETVGGDITTFYAASGTYFNRTQDDKTWIRAEWTIKFQNAAGTTIDSFTFTLPRNFCSYRGETPFTIEPTRSAFNFYDVIKRATARGVKPAGYQGGC